MIITKEYRDAEKGAPFCVALGTFDGLHLGHLQLIERLKENAEIYHSNSMMYTFENHPRLLLNPDKNLYLITENGEKTKKIGKQKIDYLFLENFSRVVDMGAEDFIKNILVAMFKVKCVVVGYNYRFGRHGEGDADLLKKYGEALGFKVEIVPAFEVDGQIVSSTLIRHTIRNGDVEIVPKYLGRHYSIYGKVISGKQNGREMGIRTANLEVGKRAVIPSKGIYLTDTLYEGTKYKSVSNVGFNPTFDGEVLTVETHILDFDGDLYDKEIEVVFLKRQRDELKFDNIDALIQQIKMDIEARMQYDGISLIG